MTRFLRISENKLNVKNRHKTIRTKHSKPYSFKIGTTVRLAIITTVTSETLYLEKNKSKTYSFRQLE